MMAEPVQDGSPYFLGDEALIRFSGEGENVPVTFWLVNKNDHTIRPFESHMALDAVFGSDLPDALQNVATIAPPQVDEEGNVMDGVLADFTVLGPEYAIKEDGTSQPMDASPHQLKSRYGKGIDENAEGTATEVLDGFLNRLKGEESQSGIPATFIDQQRNDEKMMAFYISALAYGEYTLGDIKADIAQRFNQTGKG